MTEVDKVEQRAGASRWLTAALVAGAVAAGAWGCKKASTDPESMEGTAQAAPAPAQVAKASADHFDEEAFSLKMVPAGPYEAGKPAEVKVELSAKSGFKCNDQYPYKFKAKESPGVEFTEAVVKKDAMKLEGKNKGVMTVAFTPTSTGKKTVAGQFAFSVCTDEQCLVERRDLALDIDVK